MTTKRRNILIGAGAAVLVAAGGVGAASAIAGGGDHDPGDSGDKGATGATAERAKTAALRYTHGGHANAVERDNENGATWEVEVTKADGRTVDVRLDENYGLVVIESDGEG